MDTEIKIKYPFLRKYGWIILLALIATGVIIRALVSNNSTTYRATTAGMLFGDVTEGEYNDYVHLNGKFETVIIVKVYALES